MSYKDIEIHSLMIRDTVRTEAFRHALLSGIVKDRTVLDFGTGSGILAMFAAQGGAQKVYAVDESPFIRAAEATAKRNHFHNIEFIQANHETLTLPEKVDLIVSEWMGHFVFAEKMMPALLHTRDRFLKPTGLMIPQEISLHAALFCDPQWHDQLRFFESKPYGLDFSFVQDWPFSRMNFQRMEANKLRTQAIELCRLDMLQCDREPAHFEATWNPSDHGVAHGICAWFDCKVDQYNSFGTGPTAPQTHWIQAVFPLQRPVHLDPANRLQLSIELFRISGDSNPYWKWTIDTNGEKQSLDNMTLGAWINAFS